jgi:hypothetical protein
MLSDFLIPFIEVFAILQVLEVIADDWGKEKP